MKVSNLIGLQDPSSFPITTKFKENILYYERTIEFAVNVTEYKERLSIIKRKFATIRIFSTQSLYSSCRWVFDIFQFQYHAGYKQLSCLWLQGMIGERV